MKKKILTASFISVCLVAGGLVSYRVLNRDTAKQNQVNPIPKALKSYKKSYNIYYPEYLPANYLFDSDTVQQPEDTLQFGLMSTSSSEGYYISQQAVPRQSVTANFHSKILVGSTVTECPIGTALIGLIDDKLVASIVNTSTWTIITAPPGAVKSELEALVSSLKPL